MTLSSRNKKILRRSVKKDYELFESCTISRVSSFAVLLGKKVLDGSITNDHCLVEPKVNFNTPRIEPFEGYRPRNRPWNTILVKL